MKIATVPAQIITLEDTLVGNLTVSQAMLLMAPVILSIIIYAFVPEQSSLTATKLSLILLSFIFFSVLALRIQGKLVVLWAMTLLSYLYRPHAYLFDKSDLTLRDIPQMTKQRKSKSLSFTTEKIKQKSGEPQLPLNDFSTVITQHSASFAVSTYCNAEGSDHV